MVDFFCVHYSLCFTMKHPLSKEEKNRIRDLPEVKFITVDNSHILGVIPKNYDIDAEKISNTILKMFPEKLYLTFGRH